MEAFEEIPGGMALCTWYGGVPSFHDAEIIDFHIHRSAPSRFRIHAWKLTDRVGDDGYYVQEKHFVATFVLEDVTGLELSDFNHQNVIYGLSIKKHPDFYELILEHCWGLTARLKRLQERCNRRDVRIARLLMEYVPGGGCEVYAAKPNSGRQRCRTGAHPGTI